MSTTTTVARHPFEPVSPHDPYCATCGLPVGNARHQVEPDPAATLRELLGIA